MKKKSLILFLSICCFSLCGCSESPPVSPPVDEYESSEFESAQKEPCFISAGVVVYGYGGIFGSGWIKNTNDFPVKIQMVGSGTYDDETKWILTFKPGQVKKVESNDSTFFHIYKIDGTPVGFIHPEEP